METEKIENISEEVKFDWEICDVHGIEKRYDTVRKVFVCTRCILRNKEEIKLYRENFKNFTKKSDQTLQNCLDKVVDYEGFEIINKCYKEVLLKVDKLVDSTNTNILNSKDIFENIVKEHLRKLYISLTERFELSLKKVNASISNLDVTDLGAKEEFKVLKKDLDNQTEFLDNETALKEIFDKIVNGYTNKFSTMKLYDLASENFNIKAVGLKGRSLDFVGNLNSRKNVVQKDKYNTTTVSIFRSEESFTGEFTAKFTIDSINQSKVKGNLNYCIGVCQKTSVNVNDYYTSSVFVMSSGFANEKYKNVATKNKLSETWKEGDEITIRRDNKNDIYYVLNNEEPKLVINGLVGEYKLIVAFAANVEYGEFSLVELI